MRPNKKNYDFIVSKLKDFGFKYNKTDRSLLDIEKEEVKITEIATRYTRDDETVIITRIQVIEPLKKVKQDIGLYLSVHTSISTMFSKSVEIFEIEDFLDFFKHELREVKISKVLK